MYPTKPQPVYIMQEYHPHYGSTVIGVFRWLKDAKAKQTNGRGSLKVTRVGEWIKRERGVWIAETDSDLGSRWYIHLWKVQE